MLIQQYSEKLKKWMVLGVGYVCCREGQTPIQKTITPLRNGTTSRIHFSVTVGSVLNENKQAVYQNVPCAIYASERTKEIYNFALSLRRRDLVQFAGYMYEGEVIDNQGNPRRFREVRLNWLLPLKIFFNGNISIPTTNFNEKVENANENINTVDFSNAGESDDFWEDDAKGE